MIAAPPPLRAEELRDLPEPQPDWALFLDLDGTLIDFARRPEAVEVDPGLASSLLAASAALGDALAIVSGRAIEVIDGLLAPARLAAAGSHGAELRRSPAAAVERLAPAPPESLLQAAEAETARIGLHLERKPTGLVVHFREWPEREAEAARVAHALLAQAGPSFEILPAAMAFELRPSGVDKGRAVEALMQQAPFHGRTPFFLGDDVTDEHGIEAARRLGGGGARLGVQVAATPQRVRAWLAQLPARLAENRT